MVNCRPPDVDDNWSRTRLSMPGLTVSWHLTVQSSTGQRWSQIAEFVRTLRPNWTTELPEYKPECALQSIWEDKQIIVSLNSLWEWKGGRGRETFPSAFTSLFTLNLLSCAFYYFKFKTFSSLNDLGYIESESDTLNQTNTCCCDTFFLSRRLKLADFLKFSCDDRRWQLISG